MIGQCFLAGPSRGGGVKPEIFKFHRSNSQFSPIDVARLGQKQAMPALKSVCLLQAAVISSFMAHLEGRKGKKLKVCPQNQLK